MAYADPDYYRAFESADAAVQQGRFEDAASTVQAALRKYDGDYALTLELAWVLFHWGRYDDAERLYRAAIELSDGSLDARVGLGWSLIQQDRCEQAIDLMKSVLAEESDDNAKRALWECADRERLHGTIWAALGGSLYQDHPWLDRSASGSLAFTLLPTRTLSLGGAYRFSRSSATDMRIGGFAQHEAYLEAGLIGDHLDIAARAALIWGGGALAGASRHVGSSLRLKSVHELVSEVLVEASASFYLDLWVIGLASSATVSLWPVSITAGLAVQQFEDDTLLAASLAFTFALGNVSLWASGKFGSEYRAAYLSQFAVLNSQDRSHWAALAGVRVRTSAQWSVFFSYALLGLESPDGLASVVHNLSVGAAYTL